MPSPTLSNALTVDFEDWYQGLEIPSSRWASFEDRIESSGQRLLRLLDSASVRATFFILGYVAERHPALIREIAAAGHEIGTHGYSHTLIYHQTPATFHAELKRAVRVLEELTGQPVRCHRAPYFSITRQSLWALEVLTDLGIRYDSSIFPVRNYRYGVDDAPRWPHELPSTRGRLFECPPSTWRVCGRNLPVGGGAYFRIYPYAFTTHAFRTINRQGHPVVFYIHPWEIDPAQPRLQLPRRIALTHYFNLHATEARLRQLLRDFRFVPMSEVLDVS